MDKLFILTTRKNLFLLTSLLVFWWIFLSNVNIGSSDIFHDRDQDGLSDEEEYMYGTDVNNPDSDGDGYRDGIEVESGYDPLKAAPGDKIFFKNKKEIQVKSDQEKPNLTEDFFKKLQTEKGEELSLLNNYYSNPEDVVDNQDKINALNKASFTSEELQTLIDQTTESNKTISEMDLISEEEVLILAKVAGSDKKKEKKEKEQIEKYLTQIFYIFSVNKPFAIEDQNLLPQIGVSYINKISGAVQTGQINQLSELKEKAQKTYDECLKIKTPYKIKDIHIRMLSVIKYLIDSVDEEKLVDQQDPMTIALYVGKLQAALIEGEEIKNKIEEITNEYEIEIFKSDSLDGIF